LDEGHKIRNPTSKGNKEISKLIADIKWILSGTPIQNSKKDIISLAKWIGFDDVDVDTIVENILLRRTQEEQATVNPRLALPGLETVMVRLDFETEDEREFYAKVEDFYMNGYNDKGSGTDALEATIRCRQAATHPLLLLESVIAKKKSSATASKKRRKNWIVEDEEDVGNEVVGINFNSITKGLPTEMPRSTSKFTYLVGDIVKNVKVNKEKCLVFCTWTNEMKLLQKELKTCGIASIIYDGSVSRDNKEAVIYNFKNTCINVLILQITCGNAGLNLQCATRVYITTPHWNPCVELQAIGRSYRKGQLNKVRCVRLAMRGTVEDRCSNIQVEKLSMICDAMSDESMVNRLGQEVNVGVPLDDEKVDIENLDDVLNGCSDCEDMPLV
jgi:SNF2 family DNA or RNA helicase